MNFLENIGLGKNNWWRYLLFLFIVIIANIVGSIPYSILAVAKAIKDPNFDISQIGSDLSVGLDKNLVLILMMLPFVVSFITYVLLTKPIFSAKNSEIINGSKNIRWNKILFSFGLWFGLIGSISSIDTLIFDSDYTLQFDPINFIILIVISFLIIPIQTTTEELIFRGTLTRWVAWISRNRILAILIPGVLFGLMHISNPEVEKFGVELAMTQYISMGLFLGLISVLDDGIELAIGMHAANNIFASIFITFEGSVLQTYALFRVDEINPEKDIIVLFIALAAFLFFIHKKYKFDFRILIKKIEFKTPQPLEQHQDQ